MILTEYEKDQIRDSRCTGGYPGCWGMPPFADGSRCHPHRIVPGSEGGRYTRKNTVPRCPPCHDREHGGDGSAPFVGAASVGGRIGSREGKRRGGRLTWILYPERVREGGRKGGRLAWALYPEAMREYARIAGRAGPREQKRRAGRQGGLVGMHSRWHVNRGIINSHCQFCIIPSGGVS